MNETLPPLEADLGDILCFSQLRWDFVYQRPHHLMSRAARERRVWYVEEPVFEPDGPRLVVEARGPNLAMVRPVVPPGWPEEDVDRAVSLLLREHVADEAIDHPVAWFYTPMAIPWTSWLEPEVTVYDCMDELSAFWFAPPRLTDFEATLLSDADIVFTGGHSLYRAKRGRHPNVHEFPSAVDADHFGGARAGTEEPPDQRALPAPRVGWFGVLDERMDVGLLGEIADLRPEWSFVLLGPTVKIDPATLPRRPNVHNLGPRRYAELPAYLAGWDVAMMPFAINDATRFISPTKTLEYLAAGRPVVSTPVPDVVSTFAGTDLVRIADSPAAFVSAIEEALAEDRSAFERAARAFVATRTWDRTWARMWSLVEEAAERRAREVTPAAGSGRPSLRRDASVVGGGS
jgi:UDP-galactopyranose mutase